MCLSNRQEHNTTKYVHGNSAPKLELLLGTFYNFQTHVITQYTTLQKNVGKSHFIGYLVTEELDDPAQIDSTVGKFSKQDRLMIQQRITSILIKSVLDAVVKSVSESIDDPMQIDSNVGNLYEQNRAMIQE